MEVEVGSGLGDLLQQAEQLTADMEGMGELPRVERNLRQILEAGQQLWSRTTQALAKDSSNVKASILLGSKGYDLPRISHKLEAISQTKPFEPVEPIRETDIQGFLKNERENAILSVIEESKKATLERASRLYWENVENEWEQEKQRILSTMAVSSHDINDITLDTQVMQQDSFNLKSRSSMDQTEMAYAKELAIYNEQSIQGGSKYYLADRFHKMAQNLEDKVMLDFWELVQLVSNVPVVASKDVLTSRCSGAVQTYLITQSRKHLEKKYLDYVRTIIQSQLQEAELGGVPSTSRLLQSYLKLRKGSISLLPLEDGEVYGQPVWPLLYYCLRCGDLQASLEVAKAAGPLLSDFLPFLKEYVQNDEHRLSPNSEMQVRLFYRRAVITSTDPFKRLVYCLLGCCDITEDHASVADKTEDYLWMRLCQVRLESRDESDPAGQDRITLDRLQTLLLEEYGESHFNAYQQPMLYFRVLFLTCQYEAAIEFLWRVESMRSHAVHLAVDLYEQNLLALTPTIQAPLLLKHSGDKAPMRRLNFGRLVMLYTRKFEATDPREALQYFYLLRTLKSTRGENLFMVCVSELVLETKEFDMLLGSIQTDGCRVPGLIDKFQGDTQKIIEVVAIDSENKGLYEEAIKLYDLAGKHEKVVDLLKMLLSQVVAQPNNPGSNRDRLQNLALDLALRYKTHGCNANKESLGIFYFLLDLATFFNLFHAQQFTDAVDTLQRLELIPFEADDVDHRVQGFSQFPEEVRRNIPDVLLAVMNILYSQYKSARGSSGKSLASVAAGTKNQMFLEEGGQEQFLNYLRKRARALITFAGMIPYRMPGDTNARLVQLEVLMN